MYKKIKSHPTTLQIYGEKLFNEGLVSRRTLNSKKKEFKNFLDKEFSNAKDYKIK